MNKTALDQYEEIVTDVLKSCSAKLRKSFKTAFIQLMILYMVLPRKSISPKWGVTQTAQNNASASCLNISLIGCSSTSSSCGSSLVKALERLLPSTQATFQSRERRLLISASSGRDALLPWNGDWKSSVSALSTLTDATCRTNTRQGVSGKARRRVQPCRLVSWHTP